MYISEKNKNELLKTARLSILSKFFPSQVIEFSYDPELKLRTGAFVTIYKNGKLRGCIGRMTSDKELQKTVELMAKEAAFHDPRFSPLREDEMPNIDLEISVLSPFSKILYEEIEIGKHGLLLRHGLKSGVFLPQVPIEQGWNKEEYIQNLYTKASVPYTEETQKEAELFGFTALVFRE